MLVTDHWYSGPVVVAAAAKAKLSSMKSMLAMFHSSVSYILMDPYLLLGQHGN